MRSPLQARAFRDKTPKAPDDRSALTIFVLRAYEFWKHPYFVDNNLRCANRVIFESLAFRLRPIAMTDGDDASLWPTISRLEVTTNSEGCDDFRTRYENWLSITDEQLREFWIPDVPWSADPPAESLLENWPYRLTPIQELWDRVFGDGPHSDFQRVLRNKATDWNKGAHLGAEWHMARMLALMSAIRPLIVNVYDAVRREITGSVV